MTNDDLARRWAPTLHTAAPVVKEVTLNGVSLAEALPVITKALAPPATPDVDTKMKAFVTNTGGRTLITAPVMAGMKMPTLADITNEHLLWIDGRLVGADEPNRNNSLWSSGDLQMGRASVINGPLNWLHEERHVIGCLATADFIPAHGEILEGDQVTAATTQPHITTTAAIWRWIYPEEAFVIQQASDQGTLWLSMECISREVACVGPNGCGEKTSYEDFTSKLACAHLNMHASTAQFVDPVFLGAAIIVPPTRPGWAQADATVMRKVASVAETAFEDAGQPDMSTSAWEQLMAQVIQYASTTT